MLPGRGLRSLTEPFTGWRRIDFTAATEADPNSRKVSRTRSGEYERITVTGGAAGSAFETGYQLIVPLLSPSGRHLRFSEAWNVQLRLRHNTSTAPATTSGLYIAASIVGSATTLVGAAFLGGGYCFTGSTITLRTDAGSSPSPSTSGSSTAIVAADIQFVIIPETTANTSRGWAVYPSALDINAQRVAFNVGTIDEGEAFSNGLAYIALTVGRIDATAGNATIDVAVDALVSEPGNSWLATAA
jgi:hypothetical protein